MYRISLVSSAILIASCGKEVSLIPYPPAPPADSISSFLPGIVCSGGDSIDFNAAFAPDGKSFYFTRSQNRKWDIYVTRYEDGQWKEPVRLKFSSDQYSEADPAFGPDGTLYFISNMPKNEADTVRDFDIWFVKPRRDGTWTKPENLEAVNTDSTEYYISFAGDGNMYFASSRVGGYGLEDIYASYHRADGFSTPENLGPQINSSFSDHDPCLPKNESFMICTSVDRKDGYGEGDRYFTSTII